MEDYLVSSAAAFSLYQTSSRHLRLVTEYWILSRNQSSSWTQSCSDLSSASAKNSWKAPLPDRPKIWFWIWLLSCLRSGWNAGKERANRGGVNAKEAGEGERVRLQFSGKMNYWELRAPCVWFLFYGKYLRRFKDSNILTFSKITCCLPSCPLPYLVLLYSLVSLLVDCFSPRFSLLR